MTQDSIQEGYDSSKTYPDNENTHGSSNKKSKNLDARSQDDQENDQVNQLIAENNELREEIAELKEKLENTVP